MTRPISEAMAEVFDRIKAIVDTPEYQEHAAKAAKEEAEAAAALRDAVQAARLKSTGVPPAVVNCGVLETPALVATREFLDGPPRLRFLMLGGKAGNGKTFAMARSVWNEGGRYVDAHELVRLSTFDEAEWDYLARCHLLAIDELGAEATNASFEANLYNLLDRRYRAGRRTILGTNLNAQEFKARFCENGLDRLVDRLQSGGRWVSLSGSSMRTKWNEGDTQ